MFGSCFRTPAVILVSDLCSFALPCNGRLGIKHKATDLLVAGSTYTRFCLLSSTNPSKDLPSLARGESSFSFFSLWRTSSLAFFSSSVGWLPLLSVCNPRSTCTVTAGKQASKHACKQTQTQVTRLKMNEVQTHKWFKRTLFIRTKHNMWIFRGKLLFMCPLVTW